jgi:hypothetical protein
VSNHVTSASFLYIPPLIIPGGGPLIPGGPIGPPRPIGIPGGIPITHIFQFMFTYDTFQTFGQHERLMQEIKITFTLKLSTECICRIAATILKFAL